MANSDFQTFLEDRLSALMPGIDLTAGSPAQLQFVQPIMTKLGTDPFETDIDAFLTDRFIQEFPDIYAANAGAVRDAFIKPAILMFEPFKRETQGIKTNQSFIDPTLLSDDDADALAANVFAERNSGGIAGGSARVYYPNPATVSISLSNRFFTSDGLSFYPTSPSTISAQEMSFNQEGLFFYVDVPVKAEAAGSQYNISPHGIIGVDGLTGLVKVDNLAEFENGMPVVDTPTFVATAKESLTEQSLVTRRGATARLSNVFPGELSAVQVIGAKDPEMQRDILVADTPGDIWATGKVALFEKVAVLQARSIHDTAETPLPAQGDTVYLYLDKYSYSGVWASLPQVARFIKLQFEELIGDPFLIADPGGQFVVGYTFRWSDPDNVLPPSMPEFAYLEGGFIRKGTIHIGSLPSVGAVDLIIADQAVHVFGHSDIYVRPVLQPSSTAVLDSLADDPNPSGFKIQRSTLQTFGTSGDVDHNVVQDTLDFGGAGVSPGDLLTIETGNDVGTYAIGKVDGTSLFLTSNMVDSQVNIRYRITKTITINPFDPKIPKLPFGSLPCNDLTTAIGSKTFEFSSSSTDLLEYGAKVGDTIRILNNVDAGDFVIQAFTSGKSVQVDRAAGGSNANLRYQVFTPLSKIETPLVRIEELMILDSSQKETGFTIPYAKPLAVIPTSDFTSAQVRGASQYKSGFVLPDLTGLVTGTSKAATRGDRRYSMGFDDTEGGIYRAMKFNFFDGSDYPQSELLFPSDAFGSCSYFVATVEDTSKSENFPPIDPKPLEALTIKSGPNKGSYTIKQVRKFKYVNEDDHTCWVYFIQIYGVFPVDVLSSVLAFLVHMGASLDLITDSLSSPLRFPDYFTNLYDYLTTCFQNVLVSLNAVSPDADAIQAALDSMCLTDYEWGLPARGVFRSYFRSPTLVQQHTADSSNPTLFSFLNPSGETVKFRIDPELYDKHEVIPARLVGDTDPLEYPRDCVMGGADPAHPVLDQVGFNDSSKPTVFAEGVLAGDVFSVNEEVFFHGSTGSYRVNPTDRDRMTAIISIDGSSSVQAPTCAGYSRMGPTVFPYTKDMARGVLVIDEGKDAGTYRILSVPDSGTLVLDRPLRRATPLALLQGNGAHWGFDGTVNRLNAGSSGHSGGPGFTDEALVNKYVTIFAIDSDYQGSYRITGTVGGNSLLLDRAALGNFPAIAEGDACWVITDAPATAPATSPSGKGTELVGLQPIRIYSGIPSDYPVSSVATSPTDSGFLVTGNPRGGVKQPYRIYRPNLRRVNPTEMSNNKDGAFYFFDTEVMSLAPSAASNIAQQSYLTMDEGTYESEGYQHIVDDFTLSYSTKETGVIVMPTKILPKDSPDSLDSYLGLVGAPVQVTYDRADAVQQVQTFIDSAEDRVTVANMLARHLLPSYVSYDASYTGGSAGSVIAADIETYINNLSVETPIDVSEVEKLIDNRGGNPITPTRVFTTTHDWDRRMWLEYSENELGGNETLVPYHGTPRVTFFIPGPDVSGQTNVADGERINLTQV